MIKIRLSRRGNKNNPFYKIVAIEEHSKREGQYIDILGTWYPKKNKKDLNKDKIKLWLSQGAQITKAVENLIK